MRYGIVNNLNKFILEFGKDYTFVGEQYRVSVGQKDFYIDLIFYHRYLQCLVAVDLKITDFRPEYIGKKEFYLEALDRNVKKVHEKPSIGIVLCKSKDDEIVEFTLNRSVSPTLVAKYQTELIDKEIVKNKTKPVFYLGRV